MSIVNEKQQSNDAIVGCSYLFSDEIALEVQISARKVSIIPITGKTWKLIYFTPGSAALKTEENLTPSGRLIESKFQMNIPGGSDTLSADLALVCGRSISLKLTLESGKAIICGGKNRKLRLQDSGSMGQKNSHLIGFEYKSSKDFMWLNIVNL